MKGNISLIIIVLSGVFCLMRPIHARTVPARTDEPRETPCWQTGTQDSLPEGSLSAGIEEKREKPDRKNRKNKRDRYEYRVLTADSLFRINAGTVKIYFRLHTGDKTTRPQHQRRLVPAIISKDSLHRKELLPIYTYGRTRYLKLLRENKIPGLADTILTGKLSKGAEIDFTAEVRFENWMDQASLHIRQEVSGCAGCNLNESDSMQMQQILYQPRIQLPPEIPCPEEFVSRHRSCDAYLRFDAGKSEIRPELGNNMREIDKIDSVLLFVLRNPAYEILEMDIQGFASPEGSYAYNTNLAQKRAMALKDYISEIHQLQSESLRVLPGEENWSDLAELVEMTGIAHKEEILHIMEHVEDPDEKEAAIKQIDKGKPYSLMFRILYPSLRKNTFHVSYISKERSLEEAQELVYTNPSELNVYEFYNVAKACYAQDTARYNEVIRIAADTYPAHSITNANAARIALAGGDLDRARLYLLNTQYEDFTLGIRAYMAYMEGHTEDAMLLWEEAARHGDPTAASNMEEINKRGY